MSFLSFIISSIPYILTGFGFLLGLYFKHTYEKVQKRRFILIKLESYLSDLSNDVMNDKFLKNIFTLGFNFESEILKYKDSEDKIIEIKENLSQEMEKIFEELKLKDSITQINLNNKFSTFKKSHILFNHELDSIKLHRQLLIDDKNFISADESAFLPLNISQQVICLKSKLLDLLTNQIKINILLNSMEDFNYKTIENEMKSEVKILLFSSKFIKSIRDYTIEYKNKSTMQQILSHIKE